MSLETQTQERPKETLTPPQEAQAILDGYHGSLPFPPEAAKEAPQPEPVQAVHSPSEIIAHSWKIDSLAEQVDSSLPSVQPNTAPGNIDVLPNTEKSESQRRSKFGRFVMRILGR